MAGGARDPAAEHGATRATRVGVQPRWRGRQRRAVQRVHHTRERRAVRVGRLSSHHRRRGGRSRAPATTTRASKSAKIPRTFARAKGSKRFVDAMPARVREWGNPGRSDVVPLPRAHRFRRGENARSRERPTATCGWEMNPRLESGRFRRSILESRISTNHARGIISLGVTGNQRAFSRVETRRFASMLTCPRGHETRVFACVQADVGRHSLLP